MLDEVSLDNCYWERLKGYVTELRVDARWILRKDGTGKPLGSLRIVSHPDLPPGQLRAVFMYVTTIRKKSKEEQLQAIEDYQIEPAELEIYSVDNDIKTESKTYEAPFKELEGLFGVKIFEK